MTEIDPVIELDVGGTTFSFYKTTIDKYPDTMLSSMLRNPQMVKKDKHERIFFDRDPDLFKIIAKFYRTGDLPGEVDQQLETELGFWLIPFVKVTPEEKKDKVLEGLIIKETKLLHLRKDVEKDKHRGVTTSLVDDDGYEHVITTSRIVSVKIIVSPQKSKVFSTPLFFHLGVSSVGMVRFQRDEKRNHACIVKGNSNSYHSSPNIIEYDPLWEAEGFVTICNDEPFYIMGGDFDHGNGRITRQVEPLGWMPCITVMNGSLGRDDFQFVFYYTDDSEKKNDNNNNIGYW